MKLSEIRREHRRATKPVTKTVFKKDRPVPEKEEDVVVQAARITRRQRATRAIAGVDEKGRVKHWLFKFDNDMI